MFLHGDVPPRPVCRYDQPFPPMDRNSEENSISSNRRFWANRGHVTTGRLPDGAHWGRCDPGVCQRGECPDFSEACTETFRDTYLLSVIDNNSAEIDKIM